MQQWTVQDFGEVGLEKDVSARQSEVSPQVAGSVIKLHSGIVDLLKAWDVCLGPSQSVLIVQGLAGLGWSAILQSITLTPASCCGSALRLQLSDSQRVHSPYIPLYAPAEACGGAHRPAAWELQRV